MAKKQEEKAKPKFEYQVYSDFELQKFDKQLEEYKTERELNGKTVRYLSVEGENRFLKDMEALSKYGAVIVTGFKYIENKFGNSYISCNPVNNYKIMTNKLDQWNKWKGKKEDGQKMQMKEYEKIADELQDKYADF